MTLLRVRRMLCGRLDVVRGSAYLFPQAIASNPLTNSQVSTYNSQGFEVGIHVDSTPTCSNWSTANLDSFSPTCSHPLQHNSPVCLHPRPIACTASAGAITIRSRKSS